MIKAFMGLNGSLIMPKTLKATIISAPRAEDSSSRIYHLHWLLNNQQHRMIKIIPMIKAVVISAYNILVYVYSDKRAIMSLEFGVAVQFIKRKHIMIMTVSYKDVRLAQEIIDGMKDALQIMEGVYRGLTGRPPLDYTPEKALTGDVRAGIKRAALQQKALACKIEQLCVSHGGTE